MSNPAQKDRKPKVSICCITYNHRNFIRDAVEGFLKQKTSFKYEIVIHDDASTDGTSEIIRELAHAHPDLIKPILQPENITRHGKRPLIEALNHAQGEYIALCEGDDYWVDKNKLQKQVEFLEAHPSVSVSGHDAMIIDENGDVLANSKLPKKQKRDFSSKELKTDKAGILTLSRVFRKPPEWEIPEWERVQNGDNFLTSLLGQYGGSHFHDDIGHSVYRIHAGGIWSSQGPKKKKQETINTLYWMSRYYDRIGDDQTADALWRKFVKHSLKSVSLPVMIRIVTVELGSRVLEAIRHALASRKK